MADRVTSFKPAVVLLSLAVLLLPATAVEAASARVDWR